MKPLTLFLALCASLGAPLAALQGAEAPAPKPNIIVIFTDDQTYRGIGYNNPEVKTPHLDALAAGGITFERAYVASPICAASRASMLTGRFPAQHGLRSLDTPAFAPYLTGGPQARQTLPNRLNEAGYTTALLGKSHLGGNFRIEPTSESLNNQGTPGKTLYRDSDYTHNIHRLQSGPPRDEATMLEFTRAYFAVISHLDDQVGQFADGLRDSGLLKNTVVFYLSDNGYHLGSHGLGNKITMHEESVRVPMFAFGAGIKPGQKSRALVTALDLYPTVMELTGATAPPLPLMGKSLLPLIENPAAAHRDTVFCECVGVGGKAGEGHRMARGERWKLILSDSDEDYLFDQQDDPFELTNRIADPTVAPVLGKLRAELTDWMKSIGDRAYPARH